MEEEGQQKKNTILFLSFLKCGKNDYSPPFKSWRKYLGKKYSFPKIEILNLGVRRNISAEQKHTKRQALEKL